MILCLCAGVSDTTIKRIIADGAESPAEVARHCGAGLHCPPCRRAIQELLRAARRAGETDAAPDPRPAEL